MAGRMVGRQTAQQVGARRKITPNTTPRVAGQPARARQHPASKHDDILTGSGFLGWLEAIRADAAKGSDDMAMAGEMVATAIRRSSRLPTGIDRLVIARSMRRGIEHMAALSLEVAKTAGVVGAKYRGWAGDPGSDQSARRTGFDTTK